METPVGNNRYFCYYRNSKRNRNLLIFAKYIHSKNAFQTVLECLEAKIINFLCFDQQYKPIYMANITYMQKSRIDSIGSNQLDQIESIGSDRIDGFVDKF